MNEILTETSYRSGRNPPSMPTGKVPLRGAGSSVLTYGYSWLL